MFYWDQPCLVGWVGWVFSCTVGRAQNNFQTVAGHVDWPNKLIYSTSSRASEVDACLISIHCGILAGSFYFFSVMVNTIHVLLDQRFLQLLCCYQFTCLCIGVFN